MSSRANGLATAADVAATCLRLLELLQEARAAEWAKSPTIDYWASDRTSGTRERTDTTTDIALDEDRLRLRQRTTEVDASLRVACDRLDYALRPYRGFNA